MDPVCANCGHSKSTHYMTDGYKPYGYCNHGYDLCGCKDYRPASAEVSNSSDLSASLRIKNEFKLPGESDEDLVIAAALMTLFDAMERFGEKAFCQRVLELEGPQVERFLESYHKLQKKYNGVTS